MLRADRRRRACRVIPLRRALAGHRAPRRLRGRDRFVRGHGAPPAKAQSAANRHGSIAWSPQTSTSRALVLRDVLADLARRWVRTSRSPALAADRGCRCGGLGLLRRRTLGASVRSRRRDWSCVGPSRHGEDAAAHGALLAARVRASARLLVRTCARSIRLARPVRRWGRPFRRRCVCCCRRRGARALAGADDRVGCRQVGDVAHSRCRLWRGRPPCRRESLDARRDSVVLGFVDGDPPSDVDDRIPVLGDTSELELLIDRLRISAVIFAYSNQPDHAMVQALRRCRSLGVQVGIVSRMFQELDRRTRGRSWASPSGVVAGGPRNPPRVPV